MPVLEARVARGEARVVALLAGLAAATGAATPRAAHAWSADGHVVVGAVAEARLSPAARRMVRDVAGDVPLSAPEISVWADTVRDRRSGAWHFVNIPINAGRYDPARDCPRGQCIVAAIDRFAAELVESDSGLRRADALRWIVHLVGDVHQPLHAGDRLDRGGNDLPVRVPGRRQPSSLHRVWDADVLRPVLGRARPEEVGRQISTRIPPADAARWAASPSPAAWAEESSALAREIYGEVARYPRDGKHARLPEGYARAQRLRAEEALARAGVRLAALLDRIAARRDERAAPGGSHRGAGS